MSACACTLTLLYNTFLLSVLHFSRVCSDVEELISILASIRDLLCDGAQLASKPVLRKLGDIRNDPKADPEVLDEAEKKGTKGTKATGFVTKVNVGAYKTRALKQIISSRGDTAQE